MFQEKGNFYINNLHNRLTAIHEVDKFNYTRLVTQKDYILQDLKIVARKVLANDSNLCYSMLCLDNITYYINGGVRSHKSDSLQFCDSFVLQFSKGL